MWLRLQRGRRFRRLGRASRRRAWREGLRRCAERGAGGTRCAGGRGLGRCGWRRGRRRSGAGAPGGQRRGPGPAGGGRAEDRWRVSRSADMRGTWARRSRGRATAPSNKLGHSSTLERRESGVFAHRGRALRAADSPGSAADGLCGLQCDPVLRKGASVSLDVRTEQDLAGENGIVA